MRAKGHDKKKIKRFAIIGAIIFGLSGFVTGSVICLHFKLPIPPLFITEMGLIIGGCLGALCALTNSENRIPPTLATIAVSAPLCWMGGLDGSTSALTISALAIAAWTLAEPSKPEPEAWKNI